ncbi:MAG: GNAT family N-acetyltransferase [Adhaeribacter sp.]
MSSFLTSETLVAPTAREPVELLQGREVFALLAGDVTFQNEWDALFMACPWATVFQSRSFVASWFEVYQHKFEPVLLTTGQDGRLSGVLVLAMLRSGPGLSGGRLVGAGYYDAEYQTWLARPDNGNDFMPLALEKLRRDLPRHHLQLRFLPPGTPLTWLRKTQPGLPRAVLQTYNRPLMEMGDPDLPKLFRKPEFRNKLNRLNRLGEVCFEQITEINRFNQVLPVLALQYDFRQGALFNKNQFRDDPLKMELLLALFQQKLLHVTVLSVQQEIVAAIVAVKSGTWVHLGGINVHAPFYANYSPGFVHFLLLGQHFIREQVAVFDLTPGEDVYKERLATCHDQVHELMVAASLTDFLRKKMRKILHGLLIKLGIRPMTFTLELHKRLYLLRHRIGKVRRQGLLQTLIKQGKQFLPGGKNRFYVLSGIQDPQQGTILLQENNLADLLDYDPNQHVPSRWEFLEQAMHRYGQGEKSYTWSENGCLLACAWVSQPGAGRAENNWPAVPEKSVLLEGIYCHPSCRNQLQSFLIALVSRLNSFLAFLPLYACISASDQSLGQALIVAGFRPLVHSDQVKDANGLEG